MSSDFAHSAFSVGHALRPTVWYAHGHGELRNELRTDEEVREELCIPPLRNGEDIEPITRRVA